MSDRVGEYEKTWVDGGIAIVERDELREVELGRERVDFTTFSTLKKSMQNWDETCSLALARVVIWFALN